MQEHGGVCEHGAGLAGDLTGEEELGGARRASRSEVEFGEDPSPSRCARHPAKCFTSAILFNLTLTPLCYVGTFLFSAYTDEEIKYFV